MTGATAGHEIPDDFLATFPDGIHPGEVANTNNFYVFAIAAADLPGFVPQSVPFRARSGSLVAVY
jgi:hypothetical protein